MARRVMQITIDYPGWDRRRAVACSFTRFGSSV